MGPESLAAGQAQFAAQQANQAQAAASEAPGGSASKLMEAAQKGELSKSEIREAAQKYEGFFIGKLFNLMFETIPENKVFGGGPGEKQFEELMVNEFGKKAAERGGFGIADKMADQLLQAQEGKI